MRTEAFFVDSERASELSALAAPQPILAGLVTGDRLPLNVER
jgi:hypothetical protein